MPVTVTCKNSYLSRSVLGRGGSQSAGHSPFSLQDTAQPRVSPSSCCVQQSRSVSWLSHHLQTGKFLTILTMIKTTKIYVMKCSHYYCDAQSQQSFAKGSDRLRPTWM